MILQKRPPRTLLVLPLLFLFQSCIAQAAPHALLVGVGEYELSGVKPLEGPAHDVRMVARTLQEHLQVPAANIVTLVDRQATKAAILAALDTLAATTRPGDTVFIYLSGHGTSSSDLANTWEMNPYTGAFLPGDFRAGTHAEMMTGLIIGSKDLRPRLARLEEGRTLLVAVDACYSGYTVRSAFDEGEMTYRVVALEKLAGAAVPQVYRDGPVQGVIDLDELVDSAQPAAYGSGQAKTTPYPYRRTIYLAASSTYEKAVEITAHDIVRKRIATIDGKPHGAFTDSLVRGLRGEADANRDGTLSANELHQHLRGEVTAAFRQTPQLLKPASLTGDEGMFTLAKASHVAERVDNVAPAYGLRPLRVELVDIPAALRQSLAAMAGIEIAAANPDLRLVAQSGEYRLYLPNGALLSAVSSESELEARLMRQSAVIRLMSVADRPRHYNLFLNPQTDKGVLPEGETFGIDLSAEKESYLLLFNIDSGGMIDIIHPYYAGELLPKKKVAMPDMGRVAGPNFGTEYLVAVAFARPPEFWQEIPALLAAKNGESFFPDDPLIRRFLESMDGDAFTGGTTVALKTAARQDIVKEKVRKE